MSWSYTGDPASSTKDEVRYLLADTDSALPLVTDEEIAFELTKTGDVYTAAANLAVVIATKFGRTPDKRVEGLSKTYGQQKDFYLELSTRLLMEASRRQGFTPYAGGLSETDKQQDRDNPDFIQPAFRIGEFSERR